jgi:hypothetical protein
MVKRMLKNAIKFNIKLPTISKIPNTEANAKKKLRFTKRLTFLHTNLKTLKRIFNGLKI